MEKEIILYQNEEDKEDLRRFAEKKAMTERSVFLYRIGCGLISLLFLAFAIYAAVFFMMSGENFQFGMLIYIIVPLIGAVLPFGFVKIRRKEFAEMIYEEQATVINFHDDRISVKGNRKRKLVLKNDGKYVFEKSGSLLSDGEGKPIPFRYDIRLSELRYFAYDQENAKFRFVVGNSEYPEIVLMENNGQAELFGELEARGIKKTAYVK